MKIQVSNSLPQTPPLTSHLPASQINPYPFTLSATTAPAASAPTSTPQSVAAAMPMPPIKSEKPTKRRRRATANSHNNQQSTPSEIQDPSSAPPKRRKHQKAPSSSSNHPSANSTPNLGYAPVPTPPLSTTSNPSSLSNVVDQPVLSQIQNTPALQNHTLDPSPRSYPNILSNHQVQPRQMSPRSQAQTLPHQNQLVPHHLQHPFSDSQAYQNLRSETLETWIALGSAFDAIDNYDKAISCFEKVLKIDQHNLTAIVGIAAQYRSKGLFPKAIDYYLAATKLDVSQGAVWEALAHCYLMVEELGESYKAYQRAINILPDPNVPKLWYGIAILYDRCGSFDLAKEAFSKVLDIDPNYNKKADIYFRLGIIFKQEHKYHKALENFNLVLKNPPPPLAISDIWFQIGHIQETLEDFPAAQYAYERVLEDNPSHAKVLQQLGWLHYQQSMKGTNQLVLPGGAVQLTMDLAIARLSQSLDYEPEDAYTWYLLGRCYMQQDKHADAYRAYSRAVAIDSENPIFWCSIGILYYRTGEFRVALDSYTRSIRLAPEALGEAWYNAAILYEVSNNQISDAVSALENAIKFDPSNQVYTTHLNTLVREVQQLNGGTGPNGELRSLLPEELRIPREPPVPVDRPLPSHPTSASNVPPRTLEPVQLNPQAAQHIDTRPGLASPQIYANIAPQTNGQMAAGTYVPIAPAPAGSPGAPSGLPRP